MAPRIVKPCLCWELPPSILCPIDARLASGDAEIFHESRNVVSVRPWAGTLRHAGSTARTQAEQRCHMPLAELSKTVCQVARLLKSLPFSPLRDAGAYRCRLDRFPMSPTGRQPHPAVPCGKNWRSPIEN